MTDSAAKPEVVYEDEAIRVAYVDRIVVNHWYGPPKAKQVQALGRLQAERAKALQGRLASLSIVSLSVGKQIDGDARREAARVKEESAAYSVGTVTIIPDTGFFASIVRGINASVELVARGNVPTKFCSDVTEGIGWIAERFAESGHEVDVGACAAGVVAVLEQADAAKR